MKDMPAPQTFYYYRNAVGWLGIVWSDEKGWAWCLQNPGGEIPRMAQYWPTKTEAIEAMNQSAVTLSGQCCEELIRTAYRYATTPAITIESSGNKWAWTCGPSTGVENTKKLALDRASKEAGKCQNSARGTK